MNHVRLLMIIGLSALSGMGCEATHEVVQISVAAGNVERVDTPVWMTLPKHFEGKAVVLKDSKSGESLAVQKDPMQSNKACFILKGKTPANTSRSFTIEIDDSEDKADTNLKLIDNGGVLRWNDDNGGILQYQYAVKAPPTGVDDVFARSGYIHPLWSAKGKLMTNDFPKAHLHHHGIWFPWTNTMFDGKKTDFWNSKLKLGKIRFTKMVDQGAGDVFGFFSSLQEHLATHDPEKPVVALNERWDVKIYHMNGYRLFDFTSTQACATDKPLELKKYHYGGLGFRGSDAWEGENDKCLFLTSEGKTRKDGHGTRSRWCAIYQKIDGEMAGVAILCHPKNFRFPQPMRIHPSEPFFCYAPEALGDFKITPEANYVSKYRFFVFDGEANKETIERIWQDYANPPVVTIIQK